jgi:RNA polymerase sigma-70 factor (ECF subfamily)
MADDLRSLADEDLMQLVRRGNAPAFEVIYERHSQAAFSLAYRMAGTRGVAEDVVQDAFLSIWRSGARYERTRGSVRTWVLGIVHHRAIDALRWRRASAPTSRPPATRRRAPCAPRSGTFPRSRAR